MSFADILSDLDSRSRVKLERKVPSWCGKDIEVPASINLEQCSGETAARYKASLVPESARVADLTGGLGVDSWAFSLRASAVWYNERDAVLLDAVRRNFVALGVSGAVFNGYDVGTADDSWLEALRAFAPDIIYLDPARRNAAGRKVFLLEDCSPDVVSLMPLLLDIAPTVMVKVSPMADITMLRRRLAPWLSKLHVVGADGECKELLCLCRAAFAPVGNLVAASHNSPVSIVLSEDGFVYDSGGTDAGVASEDRGRPWPREWEGPAPSGVGAMSEAKSFGGDFCEEQPESAERKLLFVPSAAMVKSGLGPGLCMMAYDDELRHFGKFYQVIENLPFASSVIKELGKRYPCAEVTARGVQISSEELRKKIRTKPGGPVHIFACVLNGQRKLLVCQQMLRPE